MTNMSLTRMFKHLAMTPRQVRRKFPPTTLEIIEQEIQTSEARHGGEICFVVEGALHGTALYAGQSPRERAIEVFSSLRLWDTEHRNAVLIYVLLADHAVEVIVDRGVRAKVSIEEWESICHTMEAAFSQGRYRSGVVDGIHAVTHHLTTHFPLTPGTVKELSDKPLVL